MKRIVAAAMLVTTMGALALPAISAAQNHETYRQHRDKESNKWRDLAIASGVLGIIGLSQHNDTLTAVGVGGAAYSAYRYSEDGKKHRRPHPRPVYVEPARPRGGVYVNATIVTGGARYVPARRHDDDWRWHHDNGRHLGWYKHHHGRDEDRDRPNAWIKPQHHDNGFHLGWPKHEEHAKNNNWFKRDHGDHGNRWVKHGHEDHGNREHHKDHDKDKHH